MDTFHPMEANNFINMESRQLPDRFAVLSSSTSENGKNAEDLTESSQIGMTPYTKDLYRQDYRQAWQEWAPEDIGRNSEPMPASAKFALIVRREKVLSDTDEPALALHSITVQSPLVKKLLGPVFAGYRGVNTNLKVLTFSAPFHEYFYRWIELLQARPGHTDGGDTESVHYQLLYDIIWPEIKLHVELTSDLLKNKVITFDYVWALFEPGTEVYSRVDGHDRFFLLNRCTYVKGKRACSLSCRYIDTDGEIFGYKETNLYIWPFEGVKSLLELEVLPSYLVSDVADIRNKLTRRGRMFAELKGFHYKSYSGAYQLAHNSPGAPRQRYVDEERVAIDSGSFSKYNDAEAISLQPLDEDIVEDPLENFQVLNGIGAYDDTRFAGSVIHSTLGSLFRHNRARRLRHTSSTHPEKPKGSETRSISAIHYPYCSHTVRGFCLGDKEWGYLNVDSVQDIVWSPVAFDRLVMSHDYKRVIRAFVQAQMSNSDSFDDFIKGKGKGFIMLLSGTPGTGKTLTAESIAEIMQKPLYSTGAGELGNTADEVERNLRRVLEISTKWKAILLLDECDVFLERRTTQNLHRNKLVSTFLRLLEYYQGVMFLTTNRVDSFDPAFESRIHLTINFPELDSESRLEIWQNFTRNDDNTLTTNDLAKLAQVELNGRQIKNVVKTARLLASAEDANLSLSHISTVLKIKEDNANQFRSTALQ